MLHAFINDIELDHIVQLDGFVCFHMMDLICSANVSIGSNVKHNNLGNGFVGSKMLLNFRLSILLYSAVF